MTGKKEVGDRAETTFLLDGMLGSLTRKLRILGYDTLFDPESNDSKLIKDAEVADRCLVTSDIQLYVEARKRGISCILVNSKTEGGRICQILSTIGVTRIDESRPARCSICNGELKEKLVDPRGKTIYTCSDCGKDYWRGTHWKKLNSLFREVNGLLGEKKRENMN